MLNDILWPDHIQWQPATDQTLYRTRPITEFWVVSIEHVCGMPIGDAYSSGHLVPSLWDLHIFLLVETNPFPNLSLYYWTMLFEYPAVLSRFCSWGLSTYYVSDNSHDWLIIRAIITATPFTFINRRLWEVVAYWNMFTRSMGRTHQQVTESWWNIGTCMWNHGSQPETNASERETNASEWLAWRKLVATLMMLLVILVFIKQLYTEQSIVSGKQGWLENARNRTDRQKTKSTGGMFLSYHFQAGVISFSKINPLCWRLGTVFGKRGSA